MSDSTWLFLNQLSVLTSLLAFFGTAYSAAMWLRHWRRQEALEEPVPIRLVDADTGKLLFELPYHPPRRLITRSEVLGFLGMIPSHRQRFDWKWLIDPEFMTRLQEIHKGRCSVLEIPVSDDELAQLDITFTEPRKSVQ